MNALLGRINQRLRPDHLVIAAAVLIGFVSGTHQLSDNSMLVHIKTGTIILNTHHIPRTDPYSFSAHGQPWVVESWLPELIYAVAIKLGGGHFLQLSNATLFAVIAGVIALLGRTNSIWRSLLVSVVSIGIGYSLWTTRPTMFGLLCLALSVLIVIRRAHFMWLVPVGILWVNSHASWPLGLAFILTSGLGAKFDRDNVDSYLKYAAAFLVAVIVGGLGSPAGHGILTFPEVGFGDRSHIFQSIAEWKSPNFRSADLFGGRLLLTTFTAAVVIMARRKMKWAELLPIVLFIAAAFEGLRNLPALGVVLAPVLANTLSQVPPVIDASIKRLLTVGIVAFVLCGAMDLVPTYKKTPYNFQGYPAAAIDWLRSQGLVGPGHRIAAPDLVGCYMIFQYGENANVFIDDRYDMYPIQVAKDSLALGRVNENVNEILSRYEFDAVLYGRDTPLSNYLSVDPSWREVWSDKRWKIFEPVPGGT